MSRKVKVQESFNQANSWANWSFMGMIIPVVGWVFGIKSLMRISKITPKTNEDVRTFQNIQTKAWWGLVLATLTAGIVIWVRYDSYKLAQQSAEDLQRTTVTQQQQAAIESSAIEAQQQLLIDCLDQTETWYRDNSGGSNTDDYWNRLLELRKQYISECYARYPVN